jgi:negative regulator of flagellin synthesis FlgM
MTEKINGQGFRPVDTAATRRSDTAKPATASGAQGGGPGASASADTVSITESGLLMSKLEEIVQRTPVVDDARVAAIKDALSSGAYEIDDRRVADRLLAFERDVLR